MEHNRTLPIGIMFVALVLLVSAGNARCDTLSHPEGIPDNEDLRYAVTRVAKAIIPSVVHIEATLQHIVSLAYDPSQGNLSDQTEPEGKFKHEVTALASGIILDSHGHIITNNHVIEGSSSIMVILSDARRFPGRVVGRDPATDLAVIKIDAEIPLKPAVFGDSDVVEVGEWVVAVGHPRGLDLTVTQGIISAKNRRGILDPSSYQDFLQTDAAINPGNSGGPLINLKGEVIGINSVIASESGGFEGIGFAIPSNLAMSIARSIITYGKVKRGWIGLVVSDIDDKKAQELMLGSIGGAIAADVVKGGPAHLAGVMQGDIILKADGKEIKDAGMLRNIISQGAVGDSILLEIKRGEKVLTLPVILSDVESSFRLLADAVKERMGVVTREIKPQEKDTFGIDAGVAIAWIDPKGLLAMNGFELGDIILEIDGQMVRGTHDFVSIMSKVRPNEETILLAIDHRSGQSAYVQVRPR